MRARLLALVETLAAERRPAEESPPRPWPGLLAWWRRVVYGNG